jgi:membrane protease YdiL (CAAX protease family)
MFDLALAAILSLAFVATLAITGRLRFLAAEIPSLARRAAALIILWLVLVLCVFYPTVAPGDAATVDPGSLSFVSIFTGQIVLGGFLLIWWRLAQSPPLARFLHVEHWSSGDVRFGFGIGAFGWLAAIAASATVAALLTLFGHSPSGGEQALPFEVPPLLIWLAELPAWRKLLVVAVAMTVEEGFFRAFLQTRFGWGLSSVLFALSHSGYGLPTLTASVFAVSLAIGWALRVRGNLVACVVAHGIFDAVQLFVVMPLAIRHLQSLT